MSFTAAKCSQQPSHLYGEMIAGAQKCLPFPGLCLCLCHSVPMCGPLFMREINGGLARCWETSTEKSPVCVGAIPTTFTAAQCYFCPFLPSVSTVPRYNQRLRSGGGCVTACDRLGFSLNLFSNFGEFRWIVLFFRQ